MIWIAPAGEYDSSMPMRLALIVRADGTIKTGADLNGKTVGVSGLNDIFSLGVRAWADKHGRTVLDLAFAWLLAARVVSSVIAGATKADQVKANAAAASWHLSDDERAEVNALLS